VIECDPTASVDVLKVAFPLLNEPVPSVVVPSLNVTVPVAADGVTVAVKVTDEPNADGFAEEETLVDVFVFANARPARRTMAAQKAALEIEGRINPLPPDVEVSSTQASKYSDFVGGKGTNQSQRSSAKPLDDFRRSLRMRFPTCDEARINSNLLGTIR